MNILYPLGWAGRPGDVNSLEIGGGEIFMDVADCDEAHRWKGKQ